MGRRRGAMYVGPFISSGLLRDKGLLSVNDVDATVEWFCYTAALQVVDSRRLVRCSGRHGVDGNNLAVVDEVVKVEREAERSCTLGFKQGEPTLMAVVHLERHTAFGSPIEAYVGTALRGEFVEIVVVGADAACSVHI